MTNEQKVAAVRQGLVGSYNLAPSTTSLAELAAFQSLGREAYLLAAERGYFCRRAVEFIEGARMVRGVLVTIPRKAAVQQAAVGREVAATPLNS